jgi:transcriptional regulator with XRE-family HTH domain
MRKANSNKYHLDELRIVLHKKRLESKLTLQDLAHSSGVSPSYLARIEQGERFPSAHVLRSVAKPLGFSENELFILAGYLSSNLTGATKIAPSFDGNKVDPLVAAILAQEDIEVQKIVISVVLMLKQIASRMINRNPVEDQNGNE